MLSRVLSGAWWGALVGSGRRVVDWPSRVEGLIFDEMAPLDPRELLIRTAISAIAGAVTTTVLVETAERSPLRRRRRKKKKRKKPLTDAEKKKRAKAREAARKAETPMRRAERELALLPPAGLTVDEFLGRVAAVPSRVTGAIGGLFSKKDGPLVDEDARPREPKKDGYETLKEEVLYVAKTAVKDAVVEKTGIGGAVSAVEKGADAVKRTGADVARKIKESVPEELGDKVAGAGRAISEGGKKISKAVRESIPDDEEDARAIKARLDEKANGFTRWLEGPGAPNYRGRESDGEGRARGATVSAKDASAPAEVALPAASSEGQSLDVSEVAALRAQLDALVSGEGAPIDDDAERPRSTMDPEPPAARDPLSRSERDDRGESGVYEPREGTAKPRPILRDGGSRGPTKAKS